MRRFSVVRLSESDIIRARLGESGYGVGNRFDRRAVDKGSD